MNVFFSNFCSHIKDSKWGRKSIFMVCASHNRSPQQIPSRQPQLANEAKFHYYCRAFWAVTPIKVLHVLNTRSYQNFSDMFFHCVQQCITPLLINYYQGSIPISTGWHLWHDEEEHNLALHDIFLHVTRIQSPFMYGNL